MLRKFLYSSRIDRGPIPISDGGVGGHLEIQPTENENMKVRKIA